MLTPRATLRFQHRAKRPRYLAFPCNPLNPCLIRVKHLACRTANQRPRLLVEARLLMGFAILECPMPDAKRNDDQPYRALVSIVYVKRRSSWKLAFQVRSPLE
jgi:hypothetical protein